LSWLQNWEFQVSKEELFTSAKEKKNGWALWIAVEVSALHRQIINPIIFFLLNLPPPPPPFASTTPPLSPTPLILHQDYGRARVRPIADATAQRSRRGSTHFPYFHRSPCFLRVVSGFVNFPGSLIFSL
ncbi:hypothetical protein CFP56_037447, partial [Quercus suber]